MRVEALGTSKKVNPPPGPAGIPVFGSLLAAGHEPLKLMMQSQKQYGNIIKFASFRSRYWYQVTDPSGIERILKINQNGYTRNRHIKEFKLLVGDGLLTTEGDTWLQDRRLIQPVFNRSKIAEFGKIMTDTTHTMLEREKPWCDTNNQHSKTGQDQDYFDVANEMMKLTLEIAGKCFFGTDLTEFNQTISRTFTIGRKYVFFRYSQPLNLPYNFPTPRNLKFRSAKARLDSVVNYIIEKRRKAINSNNSSDHEGVGDNNDLLEQLMSSRDAKTGQGLNNQQLHDEVLSLIFAGHETTAVALSWVWYLLAKHPQCEVRLHQELARVLGGRTPNVQDLGNLPYTRMVIEETLRLYPPAWIILRRTKVNDNIGGYELEADHTVSIPIYVLHRQAELWPNPDEFDPQRFSPENCASRPKFAYLPFGAGPHQCVGNHFALMEAQLILATIAQKYRLRLKGENVVIQPEPLLTLRPKKGLPMQLLPR